MSLIYCSCMCFSFVPFMCCGMGKTLILRNQWKCIRLKSLLCVCRIAPSNILILASASRNQVAKTQHNRYLEVVTTVLDSSGSWRASLYGRPVSCLNIVKLCCCSEILHHNYQKHITFSSREIRVLCLDLIRAVVNYVCVAGVEIVRIQLLVSRIIIDTI